MDFAPHPAQVATAVSDDPLYRFRVGHPVGRTHGGNVLPVHRLQRDEPAPDTAVELPVAPAVRPHTLPDALFEVVRRAQHDTGTTLQPVLQADKQAQRALRQLVGPRPSTPSGSSLRPSVRTMPSAMSATVPT